MKKTRKSKDMGLLFYVCNFCNIFVHMNILYEDPLCVFTEGLYIHDVRDTKVHTSYHHYMILSTLTVLEI